MARPKGKRGKRFRGRVQNPAKPGKQIERGFATYAEKRAWEIAQKAAQNNGSWVNPRHGELPFGAVADEWVATLISRQPRTTSGYVGILEYHLRPRWGDSKLKAISPARVQAFVNEIHRGDPKKEVKPLAPATIKHVVNVLSGVYVFAIKRGYVENNPTAGVEYPAGSPQPEQTVLTHDEIRAVGNAITPHYAPHMRFAAYTGARAGELWGLRWRNVDLLKGTLHIKEALKEVSAAVAATVPPNQRVGRTLITGPTKTHATRVITLPSFLRAELQALASSVPSGPAPEAFVFLTPNGKPMRQSPFYQGHFQPAVKRALPPHKHGCRFHDLRHTCVALLIDAGAHPKQIQVRLGHKSIEMTLGVYGHLFPSAEAPLADALEAGYQAAALPVDNVVALRH